MRFLKSSKSKAVVKEAKNSEENPIFRIAGSKWPTQQPTDDDREYAASPAVQKILDTHSSLSKIQPHMPGYPRCVIDLVWNARNAGSA